MEPHLRAIASSRESTYKLVEYVAGVLYKTQLCSFWRLVVFDLLRLYTCRPANGYIMRFLEGVGELREHQSIVTSLSRTAVRIPRNVLTTLLNESIANHYYVVIQHRNKTRAAFNEPFVRLAAMLIGIYDAMREAHDTLRIRCRLAYRTALVKVEAVEYELKRIGTSHQMSRQVRCFNQLAMTKKFHDDEIANYREYYRATIRKLDESRYAALCKFVCPRAWIDHSVKISHSLDLFYELLATHFNKLA